MKIGIIVYSQTGNTLNVAEKIKEALTEKKYDATIEQVTKDLTQSTASKIVLDNCPDINKYDILIFGAPVHGFNLALEMQEYLQQINSLESKRVSTFITHHFSLAWLGGTRSLKQMDTSVKNKGSLTGISGIINWSNKNRNIEIEELVKRIVADID